MKKQTAHHLSLPVLIVVTAALFLTLYGLKMIVWPSVTTDSRSFLVKPSPAVIPTSEFIGRYTNEGRQLILMSDGVATLTTTQPSPQLPLIQTGTWLNSPPHFAIVTLTFQGSESINPPLLIRLEKSGKHLHAVEYAPEFNDKKSLKFTKE